MFLVQAIVGEVVGLEKYEHADGGAAQEDGAGEALAGRIGDGGHELHEADAGAEAVDSLNLDVSQDVGLTVKAVLGVILKGHVGSEGCDPVLFFFSTWPDSSLGREGLDLESREREDFILRKAVDEIDWDVCIGEFERCHLVDASFLCGRKDGLPESCAASHW